MPVHVEHRPQKDGRDWAIIEDSTGHVKGRSYSKKNAEISASKRNSAWGKKEQ